VTAVARMAGDMADYIAERVTQDNNGTWFTDDETDAYVLEHLDRLDTDGLRKMRATATFLLGLTASALASSGAAPAVQHMHSNNADLPSLSIDTTEGT
jgi:hypothetical protein